MHRGRPASLAPRQAGNQSVVIGLKLLTEIVRFGRPAALTAIAAQMGLSPSRTHRYLASLCEAGFVSKDEETGRYGIGTEAIELGLAAASKLDGVELAGPTMEDLTRKTGLVSYLCVWGSNGPTIIRRELGAVQTAVRVQEGSNLSMLTATGQIFLAHLAREQTKKILARDLAEWNAEHPLAEKLSEDDLMKKIDRVRRNAIARTTGLRHPNWTALSCPLFGKSERLLMALTLIGVSKLFDTKLTGETAAQLKAAADFLSETLARRRD